MIMIFLDGIQPKNSLEPAPFMTPCGPFVTMSRRMIILTFLNLPKQAIAIYEPSCIPVVPISFYPVFEFDCFVLWHSQET